MHPDWTEWGSYSFLARKHVFHDSQQNHIFFAPRARDPPLNDAKCPYSKYSNHFASFLRPQRPLEFHSLSIEDVPVDVQRTVACLDANVSALDGKVFLVHM